MPDPNLQLGDRFSAIIVQIFRANGQMIGWGDRFSASFGLTSARWQVLGALAMAPQLLTAPQIAINMGITRQGVQKQLNALMDKGLIEKQPNPYHKRSPFFRLTADGKVLFRRIDSDWGRHADRIGREFSAASLATTMQVLNRIHELHQSADEGTSP